MKITDKILERRNDFQLKRLNPTKLFVSEKVWKELEKGWETTFFGDFIKIFGMDVHKVDNLKDDEFYISC